MEVSPITNNPKVRNLKYDLEVEFLGSIEDYKLFNKTVGNETLEHWIKNWLYEFNNNYSNDLSILYNPINIPQQQKFYKLVKEYIEPKLTNTGIRFKNAKFTAV